MNEAIAVSRFDPMRYMGAGKLSLSEWFYQISLREKAMLFLDLRDEAVKEMGDIIGPLTELVATLLSDGIVRRKLDCVGLNPLVLSPTYTATVCPLSCESVRAMGEELSHIDEINERYNTLATTPMEENEHEKQLDALDSDSLAELQKPYDRFVQERGECLNRFNVVVELNATDEQILSDFRTWLKETRALYGIPAPKKKFSAAVLHKWAEHRLLAYLDLCILYRYLGLTLTDVKAADLVFPDRRGEVGEDKIRKTVKPQALNLVTEEMLCAFQAELGVWC